MAWFEPMMAQAEDAAALILAHQPPAPAPQGGDARPEPATGIGLALADAGYLSRRNLTCPGPDRLIATGKRRDLEKTARDSAAASPDAGQDDDADTGQDDDPITTMAARLATEDGITAYRQRGHIAETPHGDIKHNMRLRQLSLRGKRKAAAEWKFACAVRNLRTAITSGHLTLDTLDALGPQAT
jgi:Transposase DDE domain